MSEFLKKWGNYKPQEPPADSAGLRPVKESEEDARPSPPTLSELMRSKDPDSKVMDFYLSKKEQEEVKIKSSSKTEDLLNFIDNIQRPFYSVMGGLHEGI